MKLPLMLSIAALAAILTVLPSVAFGGVMSYEGVGLNEVATLHAAGFMADNLTVYAGQERVNYNGVDYLGYCVDLNHYAATADVTAIPVTALPHGQQVAYLFNTYAPEVTTPRQASALAVAVWELVSESSPDLNALTGSFNVSSNPDIAAAANLLLADLPASYSASNMPMVLYSQNAQAFVVAGQPAVPEPATLAVLLGGGLLALGRRRRHNAHG